MKPATISIFILVALFAGCWGNSDPRKEKIQKPAKKRTQPIVKKELKKPAKEEQRKLPFNVARTPLEWGAPKPKKGNLVFRSEEELRKAWLAHQGKSEELPKVDFKQNMVVAMFLDAGEYDVSPSVTAVRRANGEIRVYYQMTKGPIPMINPCVVFVMKKEDAKVVFQRLAS